MLSLLDRTEHVQVTNALIGLITDLLQQRGEMLSHAPYSLHIEQLGGVVEMQRQTSAMIFLTVQLQIELGLAAVPRQFISQQPWQTAQSTQIPLLMIEHHLKQTLLPSLRKDFEQLLKRQVLMGLSPQGRMKGFVEYLRKRLTRLNRPTQYQGVDEEAHQPLGFNTRTVGTRHANANIALPAVAMQQALEGCQQDHKHRRAMFLSRITQRAAQAFIEQHAVARRLMFT